MNHLKTKAFLGTPTTKGISAERYRTSLQLLGIIPQACKYKHGLIQEPQCQDLLQVDETLNIYRLEPQIFLSIRDSIENIKVATGTRLTYEINYYNQKLIDIGHEALDLIDDICALSVGAYLVGGR